MNFLNSTRSKMVQKLSIALVVLTVSAPAWSMGKGSSSDGANDTLTAIEDLALNVAVIYAQTDPKYAPILAALGIRNADDVKKLIRGDVSGLNFNSVLAYLVTKYAAKDKNVASWLNKIGVHNAND